MISTAEKNEIDLKIQTLANQANTLWKCAGIVLVFWMSAGFCMLEAGSIRAKNVQNIMFKNILNVTMTGIIFYFYGYAFIYGTDGNFGFWGGSSGKGYVGSWSSEGLLKNDAEEMTNWTFQWTFAMTALTIISGGMAERANSFGYIMTIILFQTLIYPPIAHWAWSNQGWLNKNGFKDFAGSGVVHIVGGFVSLFGCYFLGPRKGNPKHMQAADITNVVLGTFILWMGWYGFNGASASLSLEVGIEDSSLVISRVFMNMQVLAFWIFQVVLFLAISLFYKFRWVEKSFMSHNSFHC